MKTRITIFLLAFAFSATSENKTDSIIPNNLVSRYDIVIDEIMADPTPSAGLPDCEWIEIRNKTLNEINLQNWRIGKASAISGAMRAFVLKPDSCVILCSSGSVAEMSVYGEVIAVTSFPSLTNSGDLLSLLAPDGRTIHGLNYSDEWYNSEYKKLGGWSLEMIDLNSPCSGSENWKASNADIGGSPGKLNSVDAFNIDIVYPKLMRSFAIDSLHLMLYFNEPLDSLLAADPSHYSINEEIGNPVIANPIPPLYDKVLLLLNTPLRRNKIYTVTVNGVADCLLNEIGTYNSTRTGLYEPVDSFDVVINEILFNPKPDGIDYVELYNRSKHMLNLKKCSIANLNSLGQIDNITPLCSEDFLLFPDDYIVFTESPSITKRDFLVKNPDNIIKLSSLPSMNDDEGHVIILNDQGKIIDQVNYKDDWHFKLIQDAEGIALERINQHAPSQNEQNWHSASSSTGYGTPTYKNTQSKTGENYNGTITVEPSTISPNNDGVNDVLSVHYQFLDPGNVANIIIYDALGVAVAKPVHNKLCGTEGTFFWHGLDDNNNKLYPGIYILCFDIFNIQGKKKQFKKTIVVR